MSDAKAMWRKIERAMDERGMTRRELSRKTGISPASLSRYSTGGRVPRVETLQALADALDLTVESLIAEDDEKEALLGAAVRTVLENAADLTEDQRCALARALADSAA